MENSLIERAKDVLNANWRNGYTIPAKNLYPFQWKWDSGFIAIGYANYDIEKAKTEIKSLLDARWENGFIPHIVFHVESDTYFPGQDVHMSSLHPAAPEEYPSTGMTQPPVIGFTLFEMYQKAKDKKEILAYIKEMIDIVYNYHNYLYTSRDPEKEGLVCIYHNWESGTDNSPFWDPIWPTMDSPDYTFERRDTNQVDSSQRPSKREYDHYLHIIETAKKYHYDDEKIMQYSPFLVQDPLFNAMLIKSNESLIELYTLLGDSEEDKIVQLKKWQEKAITRFNEKLFDQELGCYVHYDMRNERALRFISSSSFSPLFAGIPTKEQANKMMATFSKHFGSDQMYLCASFDPQHSSFEAQRYWRGPVWINLNWILYRGLLRYEYLELAARIKQESIDLIERFGFYEYFDPRKDENVTKGYGGDNFSWTAALFIDFLSE